MIFDWTSAQNRINSTLNSSLDVVTETIQNCPGLSASQLLDCRNSVGAKFGSIDFNQKVALNGTCAQDAMTSQDTENKITALFQQNAQALAQGLSFADATTTSNILSLFGDVETQMKATFEQNCGSSVLSQAVDCSGSQGFEVKALTFTQAIDDTRSCTQKSESLQKAVNDLAEQVDQKAVSEQKGLFGGLGAILIAIAAILGLIIFAGGGKGGKPGQTVIWKFFMVLSVIVLLVSALMVFLYLMNWWPYKKVYLTTSDEDRKKNLTLFIPFAIAGGVSLVTIIGLMLYSSHRQTTLENATAKGPAKGSAKGSASSSPA